MGACWEFCEAEVVCLGGDLMLSGVFCFLVFFCSLATTKFACSSHICLYVRIGVCVCCVYVCMCVHAYVYLYMCMFMSTPLTWFDRILVIIGGHSHNDDFWFSVSLQLFSIVRRRVGGLLDYWAWGVSASRNLHALNPIWRRSTECF